MVLGLWKIVRELVARFVIPSNQMKPLKMCTSTTRKGELLLFASAEGACILSKMGYGYGVWLVTVIIRTLRGTKSGWHFLAMKSYDQISFWPDFPIVIIYNLKRTGYGVTGWAYFSAIFLFLLSFIHNLATIETVPGVSETFLIFWVALVAHLGSITACGVVW